MRDIKLKDIKKIHFTGIKGVGMTALALCVRDLGIKVTGSDIEEKFVTDKTLKQTKICWKKGFKKENVGKPDLLIYTCAHQGEKNPEVIYAKKQKIPVLSHAQALGLFMQDKESISVCGVGGKTTTSSIMATLLDQAGLNPSFAIGVGSINPLGLPGRYNKKGKYFVAEADEYITAPRIRKPRFMYQNPKIIVITNIELDHPDVYKNIGQTIDVFKKFVEKLPENGLLVCCIDNDKIKKLLQLIKVPYQTYGFSPLADWQIIKVSWLPGKMTFSIKNKDIETEDLVINIPGKFNILNATAAWVVGNFLGIGFNQLKQGLKAFKGTKRRFEFIENIDGISLYDDYAHHPIEIKATLEAAKKWFGGRRIIAVFQPHTYSRTKVLLADFAKSFIDADLIIITDIYASAREKKEDFKVSSKDLADKMRKQKANVFYLPGETQVAEFLKENTKKGDVIFTLGAGDIFLWHEDIIKKLKMKN